MVTFKMSSEVIAMIAIVFVILFGEKIKKT